jgi:hypothetical protein
MMAPGETPVGKGISALWTAVQFLFGPRDIATRVDGLQHQQQAGVRQVQQGWCNSLWGHPV